MKPLPLPPRRRRRRRCCPPLLPAVAARRCCPPLNVVSSEMTRRTDHMVTNVEKPSPLYRRTYTIRSRQPCASAVEYYMHKQHIIAMDIGQLRSVTQGMASYVPHACQCDGLRHTGPVPREHSHRRCTNWVAKSPRYGRAASQGGWAAWATRASTIDSRESACAVSACLLLEPPATSRQCRNPTWTFRDSLQRPASSIQRPDKPEASLVSWYVTSGCAVFPKRTDVQNHHLPRDKGAGITWNRMVRCDLLSRRAGRGWSSQQYIADGCPIDECYSEPTIAPCHADPCHAEWYPS
jgi:hypothetical protein